MLDRHTDRWNPVTVNIDNVSMWSALCIVLDRHTDRWNPVTIYIDNVSMWSALLCWTPDVASWGW